MKNITRIRSNTYQTNFRIDNILQEIHCNIIYTKELERSDYCFNPWIMPLKFSNVRLGNLLAHCLGWTCFSYDESSQNFTLYVQFMLAFIQTTEFRGNLPKKAEFVRNYSLHTAFISWEHLKTTCTLKFTHKHIREQDILSKYA